MSDSALQPVSDPHIDVPQEPFSGEHPLKTGMRQNLFSMQTLATSWSLAYPLILYWRRIQRWRC